MTPVEQPRDTKAAVISHVHGQTKSGGELVCRDAAGFHLPLFLTQGALSLPLSEKHKLEAD